MAKAVKTIGVLTSGGERVDRSQRGISERVK